MQWIETDSDTHRRRDATFIKPMLTRRLLGCENFENATGLRTDPPTGDVDAHILVFSQRDSNKVYLERLL